MSATTLADFPCTALEAAAREVIRATDAYRDAVNGYGHPGEEHNQDLHEVLSPEIDVFETVSDCSACGGAQYGSEDDLQGAIARLRDALGLPRFQWEQHFARADEVPA